MRGKVFASLLVVCGTLFVFLTLIPACTPDTAAPQRVEQATVVNPTFATPDTARLARTVNIEPFTDKACLDCHTNESLLTKLAPAEEEETAESLSSGPG